MRDQRIDFAKNGKNNKLAAPGEWLSAGRLFDRDRVQRVALHVNDKCFELFRENTLPGFAHALSPQEIEHQLLRVPSADLVGISWFAQLQPSRKHDMLGQAWASYFWDIGLGDKVGNMIVLYAMNPDQRIKWRDNSLRPFDSREIDRLREEGHQIIQEKRGTTISLSLESVAVTQRRSLFHEIGHHVDRTANPARFNQVTNLEKEKYAERYASRLLSLQ
jgi:hypothetical protein